MIKNKKILIVGAGGFIGGHLVNRLLKDGNSIVATDIKPKEFWFQDFSEAKNHYAMDMKDISNCREVTKNIDFVFNIIEVLLGSMYVINYNHTIINRKKNRIRKYTCKLLVLIPLSRSANQKSL